VPALRIEGFVIVSADGMLANADRRMPDTLKFEGDKRFFSTALDQAALIVHGRNSAEDQPNAPKRQRLIVTRKVAALAADPTNSRATQWNPAGASFEEACDFTGVQAGSVAIIGGPAVFDLFMDRYDTFWLSQAPHVRLPGGEGCFSGVPELTPQLILAAHGLKPGEAKILEASQDVSVTPWRRVN
jgi:dihydrofolate reductase